MQYMIISRDRRWRDCKMAANETPPVRFIEADEKIVAELFLLEISSAGFHCISQLFNH